MKKILAIALLMLVLFSTGMAAAVVDLSGVNPDVFKELRGNDTDVLAPFDGFTWGNPKFDPSMLDDKALTELTDWAKIIPEIPVQGA